MRSLFLLVILASMARLCAGEGMLVHQCRKKLDRNREAWLAGAPDANTTDLLARADNLLAQPIPAITAKKHPSPSDDPRDYHSIGIYWWKNPLTGIPYWHKDGVYNPESEEYDRPKLEAFARNSLALSRAYYITRNQKYADGALRYFRSWYIDEKSRMNPHFRHAQAWPGWNTGSAMGIIEGVAFAKSAPDAVTILRLCDALPDEDYSAIRAWYADLAHWLQKSSRGRSIAKAANNHGSWYDMQLCTYLLFLGDTAQTASIVSRVGEKRIAPRVRPDGSQPDELHRTKSFSYSLYNLDALVTLCEMGDKCGVDIWSYRSPQGASISAALDFLIPYATGQKVWPYQQIVEMSPSSLARLLKRAAPHYPDKQYALIGGQLLGTSKENVAGK